MATYPGMSLSGEVRESVSLDEDDLSDVEDEVFIRDGKNGFKFAEDIGVKRPLMAPRRKVGRPDISSRLKNRPPCRAFCKPCCYILASITVLIGLIVLVVLLLTLFPLPLNKLRDWILSKTDEDEIPLKLLPCNELKVTDVWTLTLPKLTSESPIRSVDINQDKVDDIIFGFGTGDDNNILDSDIFCPIFLGVPPPCKGGVIALNGINGNILWRIWMNDTIFSLICTSDLNGDGILDCLAQGSEGTLCVINSKNGSIIWRINSTQMDIYMGNFIPDQDNDTIDDVLTSHTSREGGNGHLILLSGKTGTEIKRISIAKTYFMPQLLEKQNDSYGVLYGTGSPNTQGNLSIVLLSDILNGTDFTKTLYQDPYRGVLTQAVLVDITNDHHLDIIAAMFNSTVIAFDGQSYEQLWNYSVPNTEILIVPTPAYFNDDNVTDFLIICQSPNGADGNQFTKTYILDGLSGKPIYAKSIKGSVGTQMGGLSLSLEGHGFDMFLFWTLDCSYSEADRKKNKFAANNGDNLMEACSSFNSSASFKFNALNQYDQPPGLSIYDSGNRTNLEYNNSKTALEEVKIYLKQHPEKQFKFHNPDIVDIDKIIGNTDERFRKYKTANYRRKSNTKNSFQNLNRNDDENSSQIDPYSLAQQQKYESDYEQQTDNWGPKTPEYQASMTNMLPEDMDQDYQNFLEDSGDSNMYISKQSRDPRSKDDVKSSEENKNTHRKNNTSNSTKKYGIFDYENVHKAKHPLLHDLNNLPVDILRETYFKNREHQLRKSKFEQRDLKSHWDKMKENKDVEKVINEEKKASKNMSENLWSLESERELEDRENGYWRVKRGTNNDVNGTTKITSVGIITNPLNLTKSGGKNAIDIIFLTYWVPSKNSPEDLLDNELQKCVNEKLKSKENDQLRTYQKTTLQEQTSLYMRECAEEFESLKRTFPYFNQVIEIGLGQMTVYRIRVECKCQVLRKGDKCAKFLPAEKQSWAEYLGKSGSGIVKNRN